MTGVQTCAPPFYRGAPVEAGRQGDLALAADGGAVQQAGEPDGVGGRQVAGLVALLAVVEELHEGRCRAAGAFPLQHALRDVVDLHADVPEAAPRPHLLDRTSVV